MIFVRLHNPHHVAASTDPVFTLLFIENQAQVKQNEATISALESKLSQKSREVLDADEKLNSEVVGMISLRCVTHSVTLNDLVIFVAFDKA